MNNVAFHTWHSSVKNKKKVFLQIFKLKRWIYAKYHEHYFLTNPSTFYNMCKNGASRVEAPTRQVYWHICTTKLSCIPSSKRHSLTSIIARYMKMSSLVSLFRSSHQMIIWIPSESKDLSNFHMLIIYSTSCDQKLFLIFYIKLNKNNT